MSSGVGKVVCVYIVGIHVFYNSIGKCELQVFEGVAFEDSMFVFLV